MGNKINVVVVEGNLTRDPELRQTPSGVEVCSLRIAHNDRVKRGGEWTEVPYYFDVTVWGNRGAAVAQHFTKGKPILVRGRLVWREWEAKDGTKRQTVEIVADDWFFVGSKDGGGGSTEARYSDADYSTGGSNEFIPAGGGDPAFQGDDDIPF